MTTYIVRIAAHAMVYAATNKRYAYQLAREVATTHKASASVLLDGEPIAAWRYDIETGRTYRAVVGA